MFFFFLGVAFIAWLVWRANRSKPTPTNHQPPPAAPTPPAAQPQPRPRGPTEPRPGARVRVVKVKSAESKEVVASAQRGFVPQATRRTRVNGVNVSHQIAKCYICLGEITADDAVVHCTENSAHTIHRECRVTAGGKCPRCQFPLTY